MDKRGPKSRYPKEYAEADRLATSRLTQVNRRYAERALDVLGLVWPQWGPEFEWLANRGLLAATGGRQGYKWTILAALGRIPNDEALRKVALRLCNVAARFAAAGLKGPTTAQAVNHIRSWSGRRSKKKDGDPIERLATEVKVLVLKRMLEPEWREVEVKPAQAIEQVIEKALEKLIGPRLPF